MGPLRWCVRRGGRHTSPVRPDEPGRASRSRCPGPLKHIGRSGGCSGFPWEVCAATAARNASVLRLRVYYPFHPYFGRELEVIYKPNRSEGVVTVLGPHGSHRKIPVWMTEPDASDYNLSDQPYIQARALLAVRDLIGPLL